MQIRLRVEAGSLFRGSPLSIRVTFYVKNPSLFGRIYIFLIRLRTTWLLVFAWARAATPD